MSDDSETRRQTEAQVDAIAIEIRETQPLCADRKDILLLKTLYDDESNFSKGVDYLASCYTRIRSVRGDGNCYYRAFLYTLCEHLKQNATELDRVIQLGKSSSIMSRMIHTVM